MAPRGLSVEEKRVKLIEIFHESKDFFQLKELEKLGPKLKGIVSQTVKEVLQSLVDDGLVQADKIGAGNFFWSFPSERGAMIQNRLNAVRETRANLQAIAGDLRASIQAAKEARPDTELRRESLRRLDELKGELMALEKEMGQYGACDPAQVEEKKRAVTLAQEAAIRWTDNVVLVLSYFTRQNGVSMSEMQQYLGIGDEFEEIC